LPGKKCLTMPLQKERECRSHGAGRPGQKGGANGKNTLVRSQGDVKGNQSRVRKRKKKIPTGSRQENKSRWCSTQLGSKRKRWLGGERRGPVPEALTSGGGRKVCGQRSFGRKKRVKSMVQRRAQLRQRYLRGETRTNVRKKKRTRVNK